MTPELNTIFALWGVLFSIALVLMAWIHLDDILWWFELRGLDFCWRYERFKERTKMVIVWALPDWVIYTAAIRLIAHATTGEHQRTDVNEIRALTALKRWEKK